MYYLTLFTDSYFSLLKFKREESANEDMSLRCLLGTLHPAANYISGLNFISKRRTC